MAIHYYADDDAFRDDQGNEYDYSDAMRSSVAREEFQEAMLSDFERLAGLEPETDEEDEGDEGEGEEIDRGDWDDAPDYPDEWFPDDGYDYDDFLDDWGDYDAEETDS